MIPKNTVIFSDPKFLNESGTPKEGADIHLGYLRCHPDSLDKVLNGIKQTLGFVLEVVHNQPEINQCTN